MLTVLDCLRRNQPCDAARAFGLNGVEAVLAALRKNSHAVHHRVGTCQRRAHAVVVADIRKHRLDLSDHPIGFDEHRLVRAAHRDPYAPTCLRHPARDITADKAGPAENSDELCHDRYASLSDPRFVHTPAPRARQAAEARTPSGLI